MSVDFNENLSNVLDAEKKLTCASGKIAPFAYTQEAYDCNCAEGVTEYNYGNEQNIPFGDASTLQMSGTVLAKGLRSQASSFTRMSVNHFFGRASFNVNKLSDYMKTFLEQFLSFLESNCNEWSPTTNYVQNDVVYMMTTVNNAPAKRTFIADTTSLNLPPVDNAGQLINTDKWTEVSGNVDSFRALSAEVNTLTVNGISCLKGNVNVDGNITTAHDMTVHGDLYVDGTSYVVNEAQLQVSGDYQTLRNGAESGIVSGGYSGIVIENYNGEDKHSFIGVDSDGEVRVGKNAFTHSTVYTDISSFDGSWYEGLTRTLASSYPSHVFTAVTSVKLQDVVYNAIAGNQTVAGYYVLQNGTWYGNVTVSGGQFVIGNAVTDSDDIATLNALTRNELVYYVTVTDNELQGIGTNQPVLTRSETTDFADGDILMWCASEKKAVKVTRPASTNSYLKATLTGGAVSYTWEAGLSVDNATCFNGCTYAQACTDIRSGLTSCTGTVTIGNRDCNNDYPVAICTGTTSVGKSTCCALTFNPATGRLFSTCVSATGSLEIKFLRCLNTGCYQYLLLHDITNWYNATETCADINALAIGTFFSCRAGNVWPGKMEVLINFGFGRTGCPLATNGLKSTLQVGATVTGDYSSPENGIWPVVVCENTTGKVYTAIRKCVAYSEAISFIGIWRCDFVNCVVSGSGTTTPPSGWTELLEAEQSGKVSCANLATNVCGTYVNTACVNASCCVQTACVSATYVSATCVSATDPGNTASKVCDLTFQAFCTNASCEKTIQKMTFCGSTGELYSYSCATAFTAPLGAICSARSCSQCLFTDRAFIHCCIVEADMCTCIGSEIMAYSGFCDTVECVLAHSIMTKVSTGTTTSAIGHVETLSCPSGTPIVMIHRPTASLVCVGYYSSASTMNLCWFTLCGTSTSKLCAHPIIRSMTALIIR